jgi:hypothetical protein
MLGRVSLLAAVLACRSLGCDACGKDHPSVPAAGDAASARASASSSPLPATASPSASAPPATSASRAMADASYPTWPPQGEGCAAFAACCGAATPSGAARSVCMMSYNETLDCKRALDIFRTRLEALHAPVPQACRAQP